MDIPNCATKRDDSRGNQMYTSNGMPFYPLGPRVSDVDINVIAHALSNLCRWGGHTRQFYSVAQHSVLVSEHLPLELKLYGLLHDAAEAYIGDIINPLKIELARYKEIEQDLWKIIARRFNLSESEPREVKEADCRAYLTERRDVLVHNYVDWIEVDAEPFQQKIRDFWLPEQAKTQFLREFYLLRDGVESCL